MSDNPELSYYQSVVDDLRVSNERFHEELNTLKEEVVILRRIVATTTLYITSLDEDNNLDEGDLLLDMNRQIKQYQTWRKDH
jgi:hypothetical protein